MNASKLPWSITQAPHRIIDANGGTVAKLTNLDMANAELIVASVNRSMLYWNYSKMKKYRRIK
jgi:hypothetical protein